MTPVVKQAASHHPAPSTRETSYRRMLEEIAEAGISLRRAGAKYKLSYAVLKRARRGGRVIGRTGAALERMYADFLEGWLEDFGARRQPGPRSPSVSSSPEKIDGCADSIERAIRREIEAQEKRIDTLKTMMQRSGSRADNRAIES